MTDHSGGPAVSRRHLLGAGAAAGVLVSSAAWSRTSNMGLPDAPIMESATTQPPAQPI